MPKFSFTRGRGIFIVDLILVPVFILVVWSGLKLHVAGHGDSHDLWHQWALFHILAALLSLVFGVLHVKTHWGWYKKLFEKGPDSGVVIKSNSAVKKERRKSRMTMILSALFLIETVTGITLVAFVEGGNSGIGLWHYTLGIAMSLLFLWHIVKRFSMLKKGLRRKNTYKKI